MATALLASAGVVVLTYTCFRLQFDLTTTALLDLIAIMLVSLTGNLASSVVASIAATLSLNYWLVPPAFALTWDRPLDIVAMFTFLSTALVVTHLLSRVRQSLREAHAARDELRVAIDSIPALVWTTLPDGSGDFNNQRWLEYTGLSREQAKDWGYRAALHPEDYQRLLPDWTARFSAGQAINDEARLRRADGVYRWFMHRAVPLRDDLGTIIKWYGTSSDIEDERRAVEKLRRSEAYLAEAQRLSHTGSWARSLRHPEQRYASAEIYRIFGLDPSAAVDLTEELFRDRVHPEDLAGLQQAWEAAVRTKSDIEAECRVLRPDGSIRHVYLVGHPVADAGGEVDELVGTLMDVTERKRAEQALRRARERALKARFEAVLDERTRLAREIHDTLLQGFTGVALKLLAASSRYGGSPDAAAALQDVVSLAQKTLVDARQAVWDLRRPSLVGGELVTELRALAEDGVRGVGLHLEFEMMGTPRPVAPEVQAVAGRVVQEALTNVVKHAAATTVRVRLSFGARGLRLSVKDDGQGFAADPNFHGYGGHWGLLGMRERAARVRGKLSVRSAPGQGTELVLLVPYATRGETRPIPAGAPPS